MLRRLLNLFRKPQAPPEPLELEPCEEMFAPCTFMPLTQGRYRDEFGWMLGRPDCRFSAKSGRLRCAVNPLGPCDGCEHFEVANNGTP